MKMVGYADHELENTYVLGGCDSDGKPLFNELTELFLRANREKKIIFPKIICRFSKNSPNEYLDLINEPVVHGTSTILYQNDDATISALIRSGISEEDAKDYIVSSCWGISTNCSVRKDEGNYVNMLKAFEYEIHNRTDMMKCALMQYIVTAGVTEVRNRAVWQKDLIRIFIICCQRLWADMAGK